MDPAVLCLGGPDERLRRHAGDVDARTTQRAVFCHRHACAEIGSPNRRREPRRAAPHDQEVELAAGLSDLSRNVRPLRLLFHVRTISGLRDRPLDSVSRRLPPCQNPSLGIRVTHLEDLADPGDRLERLRDRALAVIARHALDFDDQFSRFSHWLPPGAFVVSVRIVAPKPVSFVRCAAICEGLTCRGSYRTTPRLSSNVTLALYTPFSRFKASRAVVGQLPHVIFEMCSRTVAVSGVWAATGTDCARTA